MLSTFVRAHPQLLSLSEFFTLITDLGGQIEACFPDGPIDAAAFRRVVCGVPPRLAAMLRHDVAMDEVLVRPTPGSRFRAESGVPALLQTPLPHLSDDPEQLFEQIERHIETLPRATIGEHYRELFAWLTRRFDRQAWVERSGGSLRIIRRLHEHFPGGRFVHLVRDGRNCAMSMSQHLGFRMALISMAMTEFLGVDPWLSTDRSNEDDLPDELVPFLPEHFDRAAFLRYETSLPLCGHYWSGEIQSGLTELSELPAARVLTLRYEDFGSAPQANIRRLLEFFDVDVDPAWIERMAAQVRPARSRWTELPPREREALCEACEPGFAALGELYETRA